MVSTRELGRLLAFAARDRAKVVLVGDHHQLPEIGAGGAFRGLADRISAAQLTQNRRQAQVWERAALAHLRRGDVAVAIASYGARGRVTMGANADVVRGQLVADWWAAHHRNSIDTAAAVSPPRAAQDARPSRSSTAPRVDSDAVMLAVRRRDVAELNARARQLMRANGKLGDDELVVHSDGVGTRAFAVGDLAVAQINDFWRSGLVNGSRGVIAAVDTTTRTLVIETAAGRHAVDALYLAAGGLDHGYALTVHKAQGLTTGQAFLLGSDALFREAGYVGLSRGRIANHLYVVGADVDEIRAMAEQAAHGPPAAADPLGELVKSLQQSRAQAMAHDQISDLPQPTPANVASRSLGPPSVERDRPALDRTAGEQLEV
jgi:ATP-dependent exoDNAse (exonuclease V) alpha subunit